MKFVGGIQNFKIDNNSISLKIPYYHRAGTGLLSGAEVYVFPKISTIKNAAGQETQVKEIIISPFHPNDWNNIYEMELIMDDNPGMINSIAGILKTKNINIYIQESLITNDEQDFSVSLIIDIKDYRKSFKNESNLDNSMRDELSAAFSEINVTLEKFLPCKQLRNNSNELQASNTTNYVDSDTLKLFYSSSHQPRPIVNKHLIIEKQIIQALFQDTSSFVELQGTVFSDTNEKIIIVRFFNRDQHIVHFDIEHDNKLGAIYYFSSMIKETSNSYNIINCYNRIENASKTAHWYVLLDVSHDIEKLHFLFSKINSSGKYNQKVIVHDYSISIRFLNLSNLYEKFPSQSDLNLEKRKRELDIEHDTKYRDAMYQIKNILADLEHYKAITAKNKTLLSIVFVLTAIACIYILSQIIPASGLRWLYVTIAATVAILLNIIHFLIVYLELPRLFARFWKGRDKENNKAL